MWKHRMCKTSAKEIVIEREGCSGSPNCAGAIHIDYFSKDTHTPHHSEIHMSIADIKWVRRHLKIALRNAKNGIRGN